MEDPHISIEGALSQAVYAKNMLTNYLGLPPIQLVKGQQPNLPSAIDNKPPAQEGISITSNVRDRMNAIYAARKAFVQAENSRILNSAVKVKTAPAMEHFEMGEEVY